MLKEIHEQPRAVADTLQERLSRGRLLEAAFGPEAPGILERVRAVHIVACGTSYHAGLVASYLIEQLCRLPCRAEIASEYRYRRPVIPADALFVAISQSGETADTLAALRMARQSGYLATLAICNAPESSLVREAQLVLLTRAGPEIGVASTKAFTGQLTALFILAMYLGQSNKALDESASRCLVQNLLHIPGKLETVLSADAAYESLARELYHATDFLFLGRGVHFPVALEGALKLKEISYIHAEGYPAGEMKHGPNALIDEKLPVVVLATHDPSDPESRVLYEKTLSNIQEVKAREGIVVALVTEGDTQVGRFADHVIKIPQASDLLSPILEIVPLQLLAYHIAVRRGCDVDQPRNLAKSVTVE
jgi:glucosamine--fructose-6-phosphate aminotransferase (isomerizing)